MIINKPSWFLWILVMYYLFISRLILIQLLSLVWWSQVHSFTSHVRVPTRGFRWLLDSIINVFAMAKMVRRYFTKKEEENVYKIVLIFTWLIFFRLCTTVIHYDKVIMYLQHALLVGMFIFIKLQQKNTVGLQHLMYHTIDNYK